MICVLHERGRIIPVLLHWEHYYVPMSRLISLSVTGKSYWYGHNLPWANWLVSIPCETLLDTIYDLSHIVFPYNCFYVPLCWRRKCNNGIDINLLLYIVYVTFITIFLLYFVFIQKENRSHGATYTENCKSMLRYNYDCVFFVVRKPS